MTASLRLTISTPTAILVDEVDVRAVRAEDESGSFGVLPGHVDLLTALPASVVRWRTAGGIIRYCAVRSGLMTVEGGARIAIACRQGTVGSDIEKLETDVSALRAAESDTARCARVEQMQLHARAVRQLMRYLRPERAGPQEGFAPEEEVS